MAQPLFVGQTKTSFCSIGAWSPYSLSGVFRLGKARGWVKKFKKVEHFLGNLNKSSPFKSLFKKLEYATKAGGKKFEMQKFTRQLKKLEVSNPRPGLQTWVAMARASKPNC